MMTQQIGFSVLSAPLAAIDRRSLSQAWYSALHLSKDRPVCAEARKHEAPPETPARGPLVRDLQEKKPRAALVSAPRAGKTETKTRAHRPPLERRAERCALARKIEERFLHPRQAVRRASFTIDGTNARVHVTLQSNGTRMRLIAVCPPGARTMVARALQEARYALAEHGIALCVETEAR